MVSANYHASSALFPAAPEQNPQGGEGVQLDGALAPPLSNQSPPQAIGHYLKEIFNARLELMAARLAALQNEEPLRLNLVLKNSLTSGFEHVGKISSSELHVSTLHLLILAPYLIPEELKPTSDNDPRLDTEEYWTELFGWLNIVFNCPSKDDAEASPALIKTSINLFKNALLVSLQYPDEATYFIDSCAAPVYVKAAQHKKLCAVIAPIIQKTKFQKADTAGFGFSRPIDSNLAYATKDSVNLCPLFILDWNQLPEDIRPNGSNDPRLYDLAFLQQISHWIAGAYGLTNQTVGVKEIATIRTILKLQEKPKEEYQKALGAGFVHELGHVAHGHSVETEKNADKTSTSSSRWGKFLAAAAIATTVDAVFACNLPLLARTGTFIAAPVVSSALYWASSKFIHFMKEGSQHRQHEREADCYAVENLGKDAIDGMQIGFQTWQESLRELRSSPLLNWKDRILAKLAITPAGNPIELLFSHGSFEGRLRQAKTALGSARA